MFGSVARRQRPTDAVHFREVFHRRLAYTLQPAERLEQLAATRGAEPRDLLEQRLAPRAVPGLAVPRDRKPMRLVAHALDHAQRRRIGGEYKRRVMTGQEQPLLPDAPVSPFRHAERDCRRRTHSIERVERGLQLPGTPVDQQHIRHW
jgi:hypothetical protein